MNRKKAKGKYDAARLNSVKFLIKTKKYTRALEEVLEYMNDYPNNAYAEYQYGIIQFHLQKYEEAFSAFESAYNRHENNQYSALYEMGLIKIIQKDIDHAKYYFSKVVKESTTEQKNYALIELAKLERDTGNLEEAETYLLQAVEEPDYKTREHALLELAGVKILKNELNEADIILGKTRDNNDQEFKSKKLSLQGKIAYLKGDFDLAVYYLEEALGNKQNKFYWGVLFEIAKAYVKQGRVEEAYNYAQQLESNKDFYNDGMDLLFAEIYYAQEKYQQSKMHYKKMLDENRSYSQENILYKLGTIEEIERNYEEAKKYYRKSINKDPKLLKSYVRLIRLSIKDGDFETCRTMLEMVDYLKLDNNINNRALKEIRTYLELTKNKKLQIKDTMPYKRRQIIEYSEEQAIKHINARHKDGDGSQFSEHIDITALFYGIKEKLTEDRLSLSRLMDYYLIDFPNIGVADGKITNVLEVVCLPNTKNIITMFPHGDAYEDENFDMDEETTELVNPKKKVLTRKSQLEKFNERYNKKQ